MEIELHCNVCGMDYAADGDDITPAVNEGIMRTFSEIHAHHTAEELRMYHDAEIAGAQYRWTHGIGDGYSESGE